MKLFKVGGTEWKKKFSSPVYLISYLVILVLLLLGLALYKGEERRVKTAIVLNLDYELNQKWDIADKVYATNLDMHKGLDVQMAELPKVKAGLTKATIAACNNVGVDVKTVGVASKWSSVLNRETVAALKPVAIKDNTVPDVSGMGLRDAIYMLESNGLQVKVVGKGAVVKQSLHAGTRIYKGQVITIELS